MFFFVLSDYLWIFVFGATAPSRPGPSSFTRFLDHTQRRTTVGRTLLYGWSARRRDLCLTTHNSHNRWTSMPPVGFEPTFSARERQHTHALDRAATGNSIYEFSLGNISTVRYVSRALWKWRKILYCMRYRRFSQPCCWGFESSEILHRVAGLINLRLFEYIFPSFLWWS